MDIEDLSVLGLYSQKENKVPATLLQIITPIRDKIAISCM